MFLRNYLDKARENVKGHNQRNRECSSQFANEKKPSDCPAWTLNGYDGDLRRAVNNACK
jgi:hypothetical protein